MEVDKYFCFPRWKYIESNPVVKKTPALNKKWKSEALG